MHTAVPRSCASRSVARQPASCSQPLGACFCWAALALSLFIRVIIIIIQSLRAFRRAESRGNGSRRGIKKKKEQKKKKNKKKKKKNKRKKKKKMMRKKRKKKKKRNKNKERKITTNFKSKIKIGYRSSEGRF